MSNSTKDFVYSYTNNHTFHPQIASDYSVPLAILIHHIHFWIERNAVNGINHHDGKTWMYSTIENFKTHFPYWTKRQVEIILTKAVKKGVLIKGNYNRTKFDQTSWYAFKDEKKFGISPNSRFEKSKTQIQKCKNVDHGIETHTIYKDYIKKDYEKDIIAQTSLRSSEPPSKINKKLDFYFDHSKEEFIGITDKDLNDWKEIYSSIDISKELKKIIQWLKANPAKANKKLWRKFVTIWLSKTNDYAENKKAYRQNNNPQEPPANRRSIRDNFDADALGCTKASEIKSIRGPKSYEEITGKKLTADYEYAFANEIPEYKEFEKSREQKCLEDLEKNITNQPVKKNIYQ